MVRNQKDFEKFIDHLIQSFPNNIQLQRALGLNVVVPYGSLDEIPWGVSSDIRLHLVVYNYLLEISPKRIIEIAERTDLLSRIKTHTNRMMVLDLIRGAENDQVERALSISLKESAIEHFPKYEEELNILQCELLQVLCQIEDEKNEL